MVEKLARAEFGAMTVRRAFARHKTFDQRTNLFNNRLSSVDCTVRDLADIGARLEIPENVTLPDFVRVHLPTRDEHFQARVKWRKGNNLGIAWGAEKSPDVLVTDRLTKLLSARSRSCSGASLRCRISDQRGAFPLKLCLPCTFTGR